MANPFATSTCARCGQMTEQGHECRLLPCGHTGLMRTYRADGSSYCAECVRKVAEPCYGDLVEAVRLITEMPTLWEGILRKSYPTLHRKLEQGLREAQG